MIKSSVWSSTVGFGWSSWPANRARPAWAKALPGATLPPVMCRIVYFWLALQLWTFPKKQYSVSSKDDSQSKYQQEQSRSRSQGPSSYQHVRRSYRQEPSSYQNVRRSYRQEPSSYQHVRRSYRQEPNTYQHVRRSYRQEESSIEDSSDQLRT